MASQAAMIDDTIIALKRAILRKNPEAGRDDPISQPTNRGNKLRANSQYVREGTLGVMNGREFYRKRTEHAGYTRDILEYNPPRYDSEGDELDFDDSDATADADAAEENPYSEVLIQEVLGPLKHPSELEHHPSMKYAYTSGALKQMVQSVDERLRRELHSLWQAKTLHRQLLGDAAWIPCGLVETGDEDDIFACSEEQLRGYDATADPLFFASSASTLEKVDTASSGALQQGNADAGSIHKAVNAAGQEPAQLTGDENVKEDSEMLDAENRAGNEDIETDNQRPTDSTAGVKPGENKPLDPAADAMEVDDESRPEGNGDTEAVDDDTHKLEEDKDATEPSDSPKDDSRTITDVKAEPGEGSKDIEPDGGNGDAVAEASPAPPRRMTTRAQANQATSQLQQGPTQPSTPSLSGTVQSASDLDSLLLEPHPLFLLPPSLRINRSCGVPPQEADETRHVLWAYIQKQEVTVRLLTETLEMLRRAHRLKEEVWEWCKAEGHVGEMSDGEDWYDREKWGLKPNEDLRKGADEDEVEVDESRAGKRGRGRRN
ncbi:hypothetical protein VTO42DRAFT_5435 [Malbranchea cinnamomea]